MNLQINCPHCHKSININDLMDHEQQQIQNFRSELEAKLRVDIEKEVKDIIKAQLRKEIIDELELKYQNKLSNEKVEMLEKYNSEVLELKTKLGKVTEESNNRIEIATGKLQLEFTKEKNSLIEKSNSEIDKLKNDLDKINIQSKNNIQMELAKLDKELTEKANIQKENFMKMIAEKEAAIKELELANMQNRIKNNKVRGENWENEVEESLRKLAAATGDEVSKITHAGTKADYLQIVKRDNDEIGRIVFECKSADWKDTWEPKLKQDLLAEDGDYAILVATSVDEHFKVPFLKSNKADNIYICSPESFELVTGMVRKIIEIENKMTAGQSASDNKIRFEDWKKIGFESFKDTFQKSIESIELAEKTITKKVGDITKSREILTRKWGEQIIDFLDSFQISE